MPFLPPNQQRQSTEGMKPAVELWYNFSPCMMGVFALAWHIVVDSDYWDKTAWSRDRALVGSLDLETEAVLLMQRKMLMYPGTCAKETSATEIPVCIISTRSEWLCSRVVSMLDSGAEGPGFKSQL